MANFAQQRKQAARTAARIQTSDKMPERYAYGRNKTQYQGENDAQELDIIDSGPKGTIVNKPNEAFSREAASPVFLIKEKKKIGK